MLSPLITKRQDHTLLKGNDSLTASNETSSVCDRPKEPSSYIQRSMEQFYKKSNLRFRAVSPVDRSDLKEGETLGTGGFAEVKSVEWDGNCYAMKQLKSSTIHGDAFPIAAADLLKEAAFLSALDHPNIVGIHGVHLSYTDKVSDNFILIDKLNETLCDRMVEWRLRDAKLLHSQQRLTFLQERLRVCLDICKVLKYLHDENIIYRDLKASNVGFDENGNIKLFDFGLAKELKDIDKLLAGDKYKLSGKTGSRSYMAPEVAKNWPYCSKVDVYSFGILLWEVVSLRPAFPKYDTDALMRRVWAGEEYLPLADWWPIELKWLMKACWAYFGKSRPNFAVIQETLEEILNEDSSLHEEESVRSVTSFQFRGRPRKSPFAAIKFLKVKGQKQ